MNVLVTGGAGYIGSHTCKALAAAGHLPITYDDLSSGHEWAVKWGPLQQGNILDRVRLTEVFERYTPAAVIHFAAHAYVGESVEQPAKYYRNNVAGSLTLLEVMRERGVDTMVFSSTCSTYGIPQVIPIPDDHPQNPINPYGASKLMVERMLADFGTAYGLRSISLRYFNAAGADPDGDIGEDHDPETHLIPLVLEVAAGERAPPHVTVYGTDYDTPDGTCIRDYIHVTDLAKAHVRALESLQKCFKSASYNLGTGRGFSVREVIRTAEKVTGKRIAAQGGPRRPGDTPTLVADANRAEKDLCWRPQYRQLEEIIATAWNWMLRRQALIGTIEAG